MFFFPLLPVLTGVGVYVYLKKQKHSPVDSNAYSHRTCLGFRPALKSHICAMAKEQDPLLTELEKKIVLFYTHPFFKALSSINADDFDIFF